MHTSHIRQLVNILAINMMKFLFVLLTLVAITFANIDVIPHYSKHGLGHGVSSRYFRKAQGHGVGYGGYGLGYGGYGLGYGGYGLGYGGYGFGATLGYGGMGYNGIGYY